MIRRGLILVAFLLGSLPGFSLTLSDIETEVRRHVRDTASDSGRQRYSDTILDSFINETQKDIFNQSWAVEASTSYTLSANTTYYSLPSDFVAAKRVVFKDSRGSATQLREESEKGVIDGSADYERSSSGQPTRYFTRQSKSGGTALQISYLPVPTSASTGTIRVDYVALPVEMSSDSDIPFNGLLYLYPYHQAIVWGTAFKIKLLEARADEATLYAQLYDRAVQVLKDNVGKLPNFRPSVSGGSR